MYQFRRATEAMKSLEVQMFLELERIKKPSAAVLAIAAIAVVWWPPKTVATFGAEKPMVKADDTSSSDVISATM